MKHFTLREFTYSDTALSQGIDNELSAGELKTVVTNIFALVENVLDPLRDAMGVPILVSSGYRCEALNKAVGGVPSSQHRTGQAADIIPLCDNRGQMLARIFFWVYDKLEFDQMIYYRRRGFIHISYRADGNNRHQAFIKK